VEHERSTRSGPAARLRRPLRPRPLAGELAATFAGGFIGALARAGLAQALPERSASWPWATFLANLVAVLLLAYFLTRFRERARLSRHARAFFAAGLCGALSTFSTMALELLRMIEGAHWTLAAGYTLASVGAGLAALFVFTRLPARRRLGS
jgi:fluoride exporter